MPEKESDLSQAKKTTTAKQNEKVSADKKSTKSAVKRPATVKAAQQKADQTSKQTGKKVEERVSKAAQLTAQLTSLQAKYDQLEDKYLRAEAEMANMTNRFKKEQATLLKYDGQSLAKDVLPVLDNLARALQIEAGDEVSRLLKHGIEMIHRDMQKALADNHITKIDALGKPFDPVYHQAVKTVPAQKGQKSETVVEVYQDGYLLKDRVLRPAMVVVAQ